MKDTELMTDAQYWLDLAGKNTHRGQHYQALCQYQIAAQYFFEIGNREQLRQIFKKQPDVKGLLSEEIVKFTEFEEKMEEL